MSLLRVRTRRGEWKTIETDDFKGKPYGEFTKYIKEKFDILYGVENPSEIHTIDVEVYGTRTDTYVGRCTVEVRTEEEIPDAIYDSNIEWDHWANDEGDIEWDGEYSIETIDGGTEIIKRDSFGNAYFVSKADNKNQLSFKF